MSGGLRSRSFLKYLHREHCFKVRCRISRHMSRGGQTGDRGLLAGNIVFKTRQTFRGMTPELDGSETGMANPMFVIGAKKNWDALEKFLRGTATCPLPLHNAITNDRLINYCVGSTRSAGFVPACSFTTDVQVPSLLPTPSIARPRGLLPTPSDCASTVRCDPSIMFIDTLRPESTSGRICEAAFPVGLTNSAGRKPGCPYL